MAVKCHFHLKKIFLKKNTWWPLSALPIDNEDKRTWWQPSALLIHKEQMRKKIDDEKKSTW
jgi:hypothetical protein